MDRKFRCEPAAEKPITVRIQNFDGLSVDGLFAWVSYIGPRGLAPSADETFFSQTVDFRVGVFPIASNGTFTFPVPDFGNDPSLLRTTGLAVNQPVSGESRFEIFIHALRGGSVIGRLVVNTKTGEALHVARDYPHELGLTFVEQR